MNIIKSKKVTTYEFTEELEEFRVDVEMCEDSDTIDFYIYQPGWGPKMYMFGLTMSGLRKENLTIEDIILANIDQYSKLFYDENLLSLMD